MAVYLPHAAEAVVSSSTQLGWMERELEVQVCWILYASLLVALRFLYDTSTEAHIGAMYVCTYE